MAEDETEAEEPEEVQEGGTTGGTLTEKYRWKYLSSVVTVTVVFGYTALIAAQATGVSEPVAGGTWATYSVAFLATVAYAVGTDTLREVQRVRNGE